MTDKQKEDYITGIRKTTFAVCRQTIEQLEIVGIG